MNKLKRVDRAYVYALMATTELVDLDPKKKSVAGKFLLALAKAVEDYENWRYPISKADIAKRKKDRRSLT